MNHRQDVTLTIVVNVDAAAARLLPGFPGQSYGDEATGPVSGLELLAYGAAEKVLDRTLGDLFPGALAATRVAIGVSVDRPYDPSEPSDF